MAITLDATTHSLEITTSAAVSMHWNTAWVDATASAFTPGSNQGTISTATTTAIVAAPSPSTQRGVKFISVYNNGVSSPQTVTVKKDVSATEYTLFKTTILPGESLQYSDNSGWGTFDGVGRRRAIAPELSTVGATTSRSYYKVGSTSYGANVWYCFAKDAGMPGAWAPGTPGVGGRATDGTTSADNGCFIIPSASASQYITQANLHTSSAAAYTLWDILLVNSGMNQTQTTSQTLNTVTLPARDNNGTTSGEGCYAGLLFTSGGTHSVNPSATITYTNSAGTGSRTGTLTAIAGEQIGSNQVAGSVIFFKLANGDKGVQSVQSITLAVSLGTAVASLIIARPILSFAGASNYYTLVRQYADGNPGIRIFSGSCLHVFMRPSSNLQSTIYGQLMISER
jgi:hypothetical protein